MQVRFKRGCNHGVGDGVDMRGVRRPPAVTTGLREAQAIAANLGRDAKATRQRRRLRQVELGHLVGLSQSEISYPERGHGARTSIETWIAIGIALQRPIAIGFSRDVVDPLPQDAGHLAAQELVLRVTKGAGWQGRFEAPATLARHVTRRTSSCRGVRRSDSMASTRRAAVAGGR